MINLKIIYKKYKIIIFLLKKTKNSKNYLKKLEYIIYMQ